jgi:hypothetical protein
MTEKIDDTYITIHKGMSGYKAVQICWVAEPDGLGYWDVWTTGIGRYETEAEAIEEAKQWAEAEGLEFRK